MKKLTKTQIVFHILFSPVYIVFGPVLGIVFLLIGIGTCMATLATNPYDNPLDPLPNWVAKTVGFMGLGLMLAGFVACILKDIANS